jgi:hypothetical protein
VNGSNAIPAIVDSIASGFDLLHPERSVKGLVRLYRVMQLLPEGYWKKQKLKETLQLIEQCSGLFLDATTTEQFAVQSDSIRINFVFNNRLGANVILKEVKLDAFDSLMNQNLAKNKNLFFVKTFYVSPGKPITQPYWLEKPMKPGYYNVSDH